MKKKFLTGSLLPVLAGAAVIGSGFSLWFFADDAEKTKEFAPSTNVTQVVALGDITVSDDFAIVFDQTAAGRENIGVESTAAANGIYIDWDGKTNKAAKYTSVNGKVDGTIDHDDKIYFVFSASITVTSTGATKLEEYFNIAYNGAKSTTHEANSNKYEIKLVENDDTFDWEQVTFSYVDGKEPKTHAEYATLKSAIKSATINVTYKVEVASN